MEAKDLVKGTIYMVNDDRIFVKKGDAVRYVRPSSMPGDVNVWIVRVDNGQPLLIEPSHLDSVMESLEKAIGETGRISPGDRFIVTRKDTRWQAEIGDKVKIVEYASYADILYGEGHWKVVNRTHPNFNMVHESQLASAEAYVSNTNRRLTAMGRKIALFADQLKKG